MWCFWFVIVVVLEIKQNPCQFLRILIYQGLEDFIRGAVHKKSRALVTDEPGFCYAMFVRVTAGGTFLCRFGRWGNAAGHDWGSGSTGQKA